MERSADLSAVTRQAGPPGGGAPVPVSSRWRGSAVTFGPAGRIVATVAVILPVVYGFLFNPFFLIAAGLWAFLLPTALRDIWRQVRFGSQLPADRREVAADGGDHHDRIVTRQAPPRW